MDVTHDNPSPTSKRTTVDALSCGALVAIAGCAVGSNRGFDDLFAKGLDLVGEKRMYDVPNRLEQSLGSVGKEVGGEREETEQGKGDGIGEIKRVLNHLHTELAIEGYEEGFFSDQGNVSWPHG